MTYVNTMAYPTIFGGKPFWSLPAFIPVMFETTVLMAAVGMFFVYIKRNELFPGKIPMIIDDRTTDDKFALAFSVDGKSADEVAKIKSALQKSGADEVNTKSFE
ncbi:MAG: quinol:electron acceptor oxidoreductase subunit ActD, partial [Chitinophagales bacterium]